MAPLTGIKRKFTTGDVRSVTILISWHGPGAASDRSATYAADVFAGLVNQRVSGTQKRLVDAGIVDHIGMSYHTLRNTGPLEIMAITSPDRAERALEEIGAELRRIVRPDYYSDEDLALAKKLQSVAAHYRTEMSSSSVGLLSDFWSAADAAYFAGYADSLAAQTRASLDRFVAGYLRGKPMVVVTQVPLESWSKNSRALQQAVAAWVAP